MSNYWNTVMVQRQRYDDLVKEAQNERLARQALAARDRSAGLRHRTLGWLGCRLVAWGYRLQGYTANAAQPTTC